MPIDVAQNLDRCIVVDERQYLDRLFADKPVIQRGPAASA
jgi:hypothetical protein